MAVKNNQETVTLQAGGDLSANQFRFVTMASDGQVDVSTAGADAIGVLLNDPSAQGRAAEVAVSGITRVEAGGSVPAGSLVTSDADGKAVVATTGDAVLGIATISTADGEVASIVFNPRGYAA